MQALRQSAKVYRSSKQYPEAIKIYNQLWNIENESLNDKWLGWEYADSLKHNGDLERALYICKIIHENNHDFKYINDLYAWCIYEIYFKKIDYNNANIDKLIEQAEIVTKLVIQDKSSPFESVVFQILKLLKSKPSFPANKILYWINKIDVTLVSDTPYHYEIKGIKRESESRKEMYYSLKTKTFLNLKLFSECIQCCDEAFAEIKNFHHGNEIWIQLRKAISISNLGQTTEALNMLMDLVLQKDHWTLFLEIAKLYYTIGEVNKALIFLYRAALTPDDPKMKVELYYIIGCILEKSGNCEYAYKHLLLAKNIRLKQGWNIPSKLASHLEQLKVNQAIQSVSHEALKNYWLEQIKTLIGNRDGIISQLMANGKIGFIKSDKESVFFKASSIISNQKIRIGSRVNFCLIDSYDRKKNVKSKEASYITVY